MTEAAVVLGILAASAIATWFALRSRALITHAAPPPVEPDAITTVSPDDEDSDAYGAGSGAPDIANAPTVIFKDK